jgi:hypothetical protein
VYLDLARDQRNNILKAIISLSALAVDIYNGQPVLCVNYKLKG